MWNLGECLKPLSTLEKSALKPPLFPKVAKRQDETNQLTHKLPGYGKLQRLARFDVFVLHRNHKLGIHQISGWWPFHSSTTSRTKWILRLIHLLFFASPPKKCGETYFSNGCFNQHIMMFTWRSCVMFVTFLWFLHLLPGLFDCSLEEVFGI